MIDSVYIISRRPYKERQFLVDMISAHSGRISVIARVAKKRGAISLGALQPFICLRAEWKGSRELKTLVMLEEQRRYHLPSKSLAFGLYFNELLYRLIPNGAPTEDTFKAIDYVLLRLTQQDTPSIRAELTLVLLTSLDVITDDMSLPADFSLLPEKNYRYHPHTGWREEADGVFGVPASGVLVWMLSQGIVEEEHVAHAEQFIEGVVDILLQGKPLNARKLIKTL